MAKKPEAIFWDWLESAIMGRWIVQRHEDKYSVGISDLSYALRDTMGWIELKAYKKWPTKNLGHYTSKQANWIYDHGKNGGGRNFILIRVKKTILLFDWSVAFELLDPVDECKLRSLAIRTWDRSFHVGEFLDILTDGVKYERRKEGTTLGIGE